MPYNPNIGSIATASSGTVAAGTAAATIAAVSGLTGYLDGFDVNGSGATVGLPVAVTVTGLSGGTLTYAYTAAVGALLPNTPLSIRFPRPIPATGPNVAIVVSCPTLGSGATNNAVNAYGFYANP